MQPNTPLHLMNLMIIATHFFAAGATESNSSKTGFSDEALK
ncbi:hypothetical protein [Billgrantia saliphila]|nr:hypothetical protein [Halomonas saliphila]